MALVSRTPHSNCSIPNAAPPHCSRTFQRCFKPSTAAFRFRHKRAGGPPIPPQAWGSPLQHTRALPTSPSCDLPGRPSATTSKTSSSHPNPRWITEAAELGSLILPLRTRKTADDKTLHLPKAALRNPEDTLSLTLPPQTSRTQMPGLSEPALAQHSQEASKTCQTGPLLSGFKFQKASDQRTTESQACFAMAYATVSASLKVELNRR
jgi:hypothetical protein